MAAAVTHARRRAALWARLLVALVAVLGSPVRTAGAKAAAQRETVFAAFLSGRVTESSAHRAGLTLESVRMFHTGGGPVRIALLTDNETDVESFAAGKGRGASGLPYGVDRLFRTPWRARKNALITFDRLRAEGLFLHALADEAAAAGVPPPDVVYMDTDVLFTGDVREALRDGRSGVRGMALTYRKHDSMPINLGLKMVKGEWVGTAATVWDAFCKAYEKRQDKGKDCFQCDQKAVGSVLTRSNVTNFKGDHPREGEVIGATGKRVPLLLLPCKDWNVTPSIKDENCVPSKRTKMLHFKGWAKKFMEEYWEMMERTKSADQALHRAAIAKTRQGWDREKASHRQASRRRAH